MTVTLGSDFGYQPENYGFKQIGQIDWSSGSYEFDLTTVWQHLATGKFYMADDSGCSCPSPYESVDSIDDLTEIAKLQVLIDRLNQHDADEYAHGGAGSHSGEVASLVTAYRDAKKATEKAGQ